ncbi:MAG TPA: helix-turn-helix transcriptional regulator [Thermoanaerobaculia bacterium]|nr:helix-turn-helix transcriptional regulator [Thermoanaerobaculia bacterium]
MSPQTPDPPDVGALIRQFRSERQMTQQHLANLAGIHAQTVSDIERGKHQPSDETMDSLAAALGVTPSQLDARRLGEAVARDAKTLVQREAIALALELPDADLKAMIAAMRARQVRRSRRGGARR